VENNGYLNTLHSMLQDSDANVVTNAIHVINEMQLHSGGLEVTQPLVMGLLNRIGEFSEWGLNVILELVARYKPANEDEVFGIMNLLDPVLRTANSGSVLATMKCFLQLTSSMPELHAQIVTRSKPPLLTLITGAFSEAQYMTLKHVQNILHQPMAKGIFDDEYRQFFVRYNEPPHVKHLKVELLPLIANSSNARDIATELNEYVTDVDAELSKRAIRALGDIASHIETVSEEMTTSIVLLMDIDSSYIRAEAAKVLCDIVRIFPRMSDFVLPTLGRNIRRVEDEHAKASLIWMLGEFGGNILEAPYALETIIDNYEEEVSVAIKLQILTASMKMFFQRPPEMQAMLGRLLKHAMNDTSNQDLHDRSLLYYRLLTGDINSAASLFACGAVCSSIDADFAERKDLDIKQRLFAEFNTLAVVFGMPSEQFIDDKYQLVSAVSSMY
jgi:AP-4 complex subunit beta-1